METNYKMKKPKDLTRINGNDMGELLWWSQQLGASPEIILAAIEDAGNNAEEIKKNIDRPSPRGAQL